MTKLIATTIYCSAAILLSACGGGKSSGN